MLQLPSAGAASATAGNSEGKILRRNGPGSCGPYLKTPQLGRAQHSSKAPGLLCQNLLLSPSSFCSLHGRQSIARRVVGAKNDYFNRKASRPQRQQTSLRTISSPSGTSVLLYTIERVGRALCDRNQWQSRAVNWLWLTVLTRLGGGAHGADKWLSRTVPRNWCLSRWSLQAGPGRKRPLMPCVLSLTTATVGLNLWNRQAFSILCAIKFTGHFLYGFWVSLCALGKTSVHKL